MEPRYMGCRSCKLRRITCDRGVPSCKKCSKRGLECPGYGRVLKWTNAVAVRGRYRGLEIPCTNQTVTTNQFDLVQPKTYTTAEFCGGDIADFPHDTRVEQLLDHYDKKIAGLMVWMDSERNAYRRLVLPLARQCPVLLLAILAVSEEHLSAMSSSRSTFAWSAHDGVVARITEKLRLANEQAGRGPDGNRMNTEEAEIILASVLVLSNFEFIRSVSEAWEIHRQAARTIVNMMPNEGDRGPELFSFLKDQFLISDVLASTTTIRPVLTCDGIVSSTRGHSTALFNDFLDLLHHVTSCSYQSPSGCFRNKSGFVVDLEEPKKLRDAFELARGSTLVALHLSTLQVEPSLRDFIRMVDIYHHAGLLYSYRRLYSLESVRLDIDYSSRQLFERLDELEDLSSCVQNLPWPVFIAGIESYGDEVRQRMVLRLYNVIIEKMGFRQHSTTLCFLKEFWSAKENGWLSMAWQWEHRGQLLLAI